jgi:hypothetical protein
MLSNSSLHGPWDEHVKPFSRQDHHPLVPEVIQSLVAIENPYQNLEENAAKKPHV